MKKRKPNESADTFEARDRRFKRTLGWTFASVLTFVGGPVGYDVIFNRNKNHQEEKTHQLEIQHNTARQQAKQRLSLSSSVSEKDFLPLQNSEPVIAEESSLPVPERGALEPTETRGASSLKCRWIGQMPRPPGFPEEVDCKDLQPVSPFAP